MPYRVGSLYHYLGAKTKGETGTIKATPEAIEYKSVWKKIDIPWNTIVDLDISTQSTRRVTAGRAVALGVFALAAKKTESFTYVHVSAQNTTWSFSTKESQSAVVKSWQPILNAWQAKKAAGASKLQASTAKLQASTARLRSANAPAATPLVADELQKLLNLRNAGAITEAEFEAQKARLLS